MHYQKNIEPKYTYWQEFALLLSKGETEGIKSFSLPEVEKFLSLYQQICGDLLAYRSSFDFETESYLNDLVGRGYSLLQGKDKVQIIKRIKSYLFYEFPYLFRKHFVYILISALIFWSGAFVAAWAYFSDTEYAKWVVIVPMHQNLSPSERVSQDEGSQLRTPDSKMAGEASGELFFHNTRVSFMVYVSGITAGILTFMLLFMNGIILGGLAAEYYLAKETYFFVAWIAPHAVVELTAIIIAGAAGLIIASAFWRPGEKSFKTALKEKSLEATKLVIGVIPLLLVAGIIEASFSWIYIRAIYPLKILLAFILFFTLIIYFLFAGRSYKPENE